MTRIFIFFTAILLFSFVWEYNYVQTGRASYYSSKFEGRKTSSGELFKQDLLTGAHKSLPLGSIVRVTNLSNDSSVVVKINDRLSQRSASLIDVSLKAAKQLNFVKNGHAKVKVETF